MKNAEKLISQQNTKEALIEALLNNAELSYLVAMNIYKIFSLSTIIPKNDFLNRYPKSKMITYICWHIPSLNLL